MEKRNPEKIIVIVYSVYVIVLMFAATSIGWPVWINPLAVMGILAVWVVYLREVRDYRFRALLYSAVVLATFALYNTMESSFEGILTTYCAVVVILGILNISEIVIAEYVFSTLLIVYHGIFRDNIPVGTTHEKVLSAAQILAVFMVIAITHHLMKRRQQKERRMEEMAEELKAAEQDKFDFLVHVSRQIEMPVHNICGISEKLLQEHIAKTQDMAEDVRKLQEEGKTLLATINDVLDFSEMEAGKMELEEESYCFADIIDDVISRTMVYMREKGLELIVDCDAKIPAVLHGDAQKLRRVILCMVSNAVKYTETGYVTITALTRTEEYGANLYVKVKDTGIGIEAEDLEKVFSAFHQAGSVNRRQEGSIGIGLAISKQIISKMDGFINAKSEPGQGSEFRFVVPQKVVDRQPMAVVHDGENIKFMIYINSEKASVRDMRDAYMSSICHTMESLELRYQQCRNLDECKRRSEKEGFTHALITRDEYLEDPVYFERLSHQAEIIMIGDEAPITEDNIKRILKPVDALSLAALLNGEPARRKETDAKHQQTGTALRNRGNVVAARPLQEEKKNRINRQSGLRHMGGNKEHYEAILQAYLAEGKEKLPVIREKYEAADWENYVVYVHAVKSNSFSIGADELGTLAKALETAGKEGKVSYIQAHHEEMMRLYEEVLAEIGSENGEAFAGRRERP